MVANNTYSLHM